jgi:pectin methylesterase-like acyl-CoA thioesterase/acetyl esterase/lipase
MSARGASFSAVGGALWLCKLAGLLCLLATGSAFAGQPDASLAVASAKADVIVAADGTGQYTSIQEAISAAPMKTDPATPRWVIFVKAGTYRERVYVQRERGNIHVIGEDREKTVLVYNQHANLPGPDGKTIGTFRTPTLQIDGDGMIWENLTIANDAGKPGPRPDGPAVSQALALRADGDRLEFRGCRFLGWQDTILVNRGRHYFADCYIEGSVDFIFGAATSYFDRCRIHVVGDGYITAASTPKDTAHGLVFADCRITGAEGVKTYLGRPWRDFAKTVFLRTDMSVAVRPEGWHNWNKPQAEQTTCYAEFASTGLGANAATRVQWAKPLSADEAAVLTPGRVLGGTDGWNPAGGQHPVIVLVGDSTVGQSSGWGPGFRSLASDGAIVVNPAQNGRSSKSYRAEGHWDKALAFKGDYYLIQFGHNDQPGKGPERETDPETTYAENMARYVDEVRAIGGKPVLITSLTRRIFSRTDPARIESTLTPYAEAVKRVAREKQVPLIDLHAISREYCERLGPVETAKFNVPGREGSPDTTHLGPLGSIAFARLVVAELRVQVPELAPFLRGGREASLLTDVTYGEAGGEKLLLDASVPAGEGLHPVAILIHGGGWSGGDKRSVLPGSGADISPWFAPLTAAKFTWFSINYRLAPKHRWPAGFDDVQTAIRWVKAHAAEFKGDPTRIAIFGHSAGGHLACLAATLDDPSVRVQAVVGFAPVTNHEQDLPIRGGLSPSLQALLDRPKEPTPESLAVLREISPLNHVRAGLPPVLLIHGDADRTVPIQQSLDFQARLREHNVPCDLIVIPGGVHGLNGWLELAPDYQTRMVEWLRATLRVSELSASAAHAEARPATPTPST